MTLHMGHKVLKVDDTGQTTLTSKKMIDTFKTCFQNNWSAKEHGCRQDNTSTCIWITTNVKQPLTLMAFDGDLGPLKQCFLEITCNNRRLKMGRKGKITKKMVDDSLELTAELLLMQASLMEDQIGNTLEDTSNCEIAQELRDIENELSWIQDIYTTTDSEDEHKEEVPLYTAFVQGVSGTDRRHMANSSLNHILVTADVHHAEESEIDNFNDKETTTAASTKEDKTETKDMNQEITSSQLLMRETEEAVHWIEKNQDTWLKKDHLVPLLDSSNEWEAFSLTKVMEGETSMKNA